MILHATSRGDGPVLVMLHGLFGQSGNFGAIQRRLAAAGRQVVAMDLRNHGASPHAPGMDYRTLAADVRETMERLGLAPCAVLGHSMGGMLAARLALMHPEAVEQLIMLNPLGLEDWLAEGVPHATVDQLVRAELRTTAESIRNYQLKYYYNGRWKPEYDQWVEMAAGLYAGSGRERVAWNQALTMEMIFTQPVLYEFPRLRVPTVLFIGGMDRTAPGAARAPAEIAQRLGDYPVLGRRAAAAIPGAKLVEFPELGHSPQVEAPDRFHEALLDTLQVPR